ncbi:MAG: NADH-quinone oxidoreductase subunit M [Magnetococcales bacterium]|nr:NADH-quinone oxidoreductase subunit M [Magnetococcales bacterium]
MIILSILLVLPLAGVLLIALLPERFLQLARPLAVLAASAALGWSLYVAWRFDPDLAVLQFVERVPWHPRLGSYYSLGVDGFSMPMVLLATLLALVAILASAAIRLRVKSYYISMLLLEAAMLGVFMSQDWSLFYVFWELTLLPLFFLINRWGGANRSRAALNFVLYTMGGSVFMLIALLGAFDAAKIHSFDMTEMAKGLRTLPAQTQVLLFLGLFIGFGVKMPTFPMHGWLPLAHVEAPSPVSILLSGVLLKMGSYGLIRAGFMLPAALVSLQSWLAALAMISLIYGGLLAWRQSDLKGMVAYSSISHMGVVLLGLATLTSDGITGAVMQMVAHGLVAGSLFLLIGLLYERTHTREIGDYGSLLRITPKLAFFTILAFVSAVGMPGSAGFVAELHALIGGLQRWGWPVVLLSAGMLVGAAYSIRTVSVLFTGQEKASLHALPDLRPVETLAASLLAVVSFGLGLVPAPALNMVASSVNRFHTLLQRFF